MKVTTRFAQLGDAKALVDIYKYYVDETNITFEYDVPTVKEFEQRIKDISAKYPYLVAEYNDKIVGYAYANTFKGRSAYDWTVESSIYVDSEVRKLGVGQILHNALEKCLKEQGIVTIEACITFPNEASEQFHKKNGYKKVAHFNKVGYKFNKWHDVVWYEKVIAEHQDNQPKIKKITEITNTADSKIEEVLRYYKDYKEKPFISGKRDINKWLAEVKKSKSKLVTKANMEKTEEGLFPGDIILLWRINFGTFTTDSIKDGMYPKYFEYSYGIDAPKRLEKLLKETYVQIDSPYNSLIHTTQVILKNLLKEKNIKGLTKMKKDDVYEEIKNNFSEQELLNKLEIFGYSLTAKGKQALENNSAIVDKHPKKNI